MKRWVVFFLLNLVLFIALQAVFIFVGFSIGLASSDKYVVQQWLLYSGFCLIHVVLSIAIPQFKASLKKKELFFGVLIIIFSWVIIGICVA